MSPYDSVVDARHSRCVIGTLLALHLVVGLVPAFIVWWQGPSRFHMAAWGLFVDAPGAIRFVSLQIHFAQITLLGMWSVAADHRLFGRFVVALAGATAARAVYKLSLTIALNDCQSLELEYVLFALTRFLTASYVFWYVRRLTSARLVCSRAMERAPTAKQYQFTLRNVFEGVVGASIFLAVLRTTDWEFLFVDHGVMTSYLPYQMRSLGRAQLIEGFGDALAAISLTIAVLCNVHTAWRVTALGAAIVIAVVTSLCVESLIVTFHLRSFLLGIQVAMVILAWMALSLWLVRIAGYRVQCANDSIDSGASGNVTD